jgi:hypothetical protein
VGSPDRAASLLEPPLSGHFGRLPACTLLAGLPDGADPAPGIQGCRAPGAPARERGRTRVHPSDDAENPQHRKMTQVSRPAAWKTPVIVCAGTVMDLSWTRRPPTIDPALRRRSRRGSNIPVTSASARRESLSDGGVPGRGPTQPIAPYNAFLSTQMAAELRELLPPGRRE